MLEALSEKFGVIVKKIRGQAKVTPENIEPVLREIKLALLEADVNYRVVKEFVEKVKNSAMGAEVAGSLTPGQKMVKIIYDNMVEILSRGEPLNISGAPSIIMVLGLQGSGKTTTCGKLALRLKKDKKAGGLVAADLKRPAAIEQLKTLGRELNIPVFAGNISEITRLKDRVMDWAMGESLDVVIIDTAGRLHIDEELLQELVEMKREFSPSEILLVVDAMTGQEAVNVAVAFNERPGLTGLILTKLDGDTRGGASLSMRAKVSKPIKFIGVGEKLKDLEEFHPERMASRILGMGDIVSLVEKVEGAMSQDEIKKLDKKMRRFELNLEDFLRELRRLKSMGPLEDLMKMVPGINKFKLSVSENDLKHMEAIISSMTVEERKNPVIIDGSRRSRIGRGSGRPVSEVNRILNQFEMFRKMSKNLSSFEKSFLKQGGKFPWL
jgi:signal recognition particle subunit SRP54